MRPRTHAAALALAFAAACNPSGSERAAEPKAAAQSPAAALPASTGREERPLPAFSGWTLGGERLAISDLLGKRVLLYFFNPEVDEAISTTQAVRAVSPLRGKHNFEIVGVAVGSSRETARRFADERGIDFPVIDDSQASISQRLNLRAPVALLGVDGEGYVRFGMGSLTEASALEAKLREALRLPAGEGDRAADGEFPAAPGFRAKVLDQDAHFDLAEQRGQVVVLIFFLHTCPHCHEVLSSLKETLATLPEDRRPRLVGVEVSGRTAAVRQQLAELDLDFFPVLFDDDGSIRASYGVFGGVPDTFLIDAEGRIRGRVQGWSPETDPALMRMRLARLAGAPVPMLLRKEGYSGSEACGVCHEAQRATWAFTAHATAFDTLVRHAADSDAKCVGCHVVGFGQPGGYSLASRGRELEGVGCESCHGRGGPHLSPAGAGQSDYAPTCLGCHDKTHSLGFEVATFLPRVSHAANRALLSLPPEEKRRLLAERGRPGGELLPSQADYVGSEACKSCHAAEHATWAASPHARSVASLESKGAAARADCLRCHTTGFGRSGGFPKEGRPDAHPDLARVGCESCHGPGGSHAAQGAERRGTILSLGDKCDSCVILQICGSCHDDANDPGFEFEVVKKIEKQRHGSRETGRSAPQPGRSAGSAEPSADALAARAFARLAELSGGTRAEGREAWSTP